MRKALLFIFIGQFFMGDAVLRPNKPGLSDDVESFDHLKSQLITETLLKELSLHKCGIRFQSCSLPELYFHLNSTDKAVHIENARIPPPSCPRVTDISTDIFDLRLDISLTLPSVIIDGDVTFYEKTVRFEGRHMYRFGVLLRNVTGSGLCFTRWTEIGYEITECDIRFTRDATLKTPGDRLPMNENVFVAATVDRLWTSVTNAMNGNVVKGVNALLEQTDVMKFLRNPTIFEKYKNYVIESTESANEFVDGIISSVRKVIVEKFGDSFAIPNMEESFRRQGILVVWQGSFKADHGTIHGLSTVSRVGDTSFAADNISRTHFFGNLSFEYLDLRYDRYRAEFMSFGPTGTLNTRFRPIKLRIHPCVDWETGKIHLEEFEIGDVGELVVELTGLGTVLSWIISKITTWVVGLTRDRIISDLQRKYDSYIKDILSGYTIHDITQGNFHPTT